MKTLGLDELLKYSQRHAPAPTQKIGPLSIAPVDPARSFLWYLATPYTTNSASLRLDRVEMAMRMTARLVSRGLNVFSPIAAHHPVTDFMLDTEVPTHAGWMDICYGMLDRCDGLIVSTMDGWFESKGVRMEIDRWQRTKGVQHMLYVSPIRVAAAWVPEFAWKSHEVEGK